MLTADDEVEARWRVVEPVAHSYGLGVRLQAAHDPKQEQFPYIWTIDRAEAEATQEAWPMGGTAGDQDPHWRRADGDDSEADD